MQVANQIFARGGSPGFTMGLEHCSFCFYALSIFNERPLNSFSVASFIEIMLSGEMEMGHPVLKEEKHPYILE